MMNTRNRYLVAVGAAFLIATLAACGSSHKVHKGRLTPKQIREYADDVLSSEEKKSFRVPFEVSDEVKELAKEVYKAGYSKTFTARQLALMLLEDGRLGITYERDSNATAMEVYTQRRANCISFTNLFVGMARSLGINANYAEVTEVSSFNKVGHTIVYNSHICAVVFEGPKAYLIDFSFRPNPQYHSWRAISDLEAVASFYNNIASQLYLKGDDSDSMAKALALYKMALKIYPNSASTYNNLGVLRLRQDDAAGAEKMFRKALEIRPGYFAAYTNLGSIYRKRGEMDKAIKLIKEAIAASPSNPYAHHTLGRYYQEIGDNDKAEASLRKALRIDKYFTEARHELGRLYLRMGRGKEALHQFALALKFHPDDSIARSKVDLIRQLTMDSSAEKQ